MVILSNQIFHLLTAKKPSKCWVGTSVKFVYMLIIIFVCSIFLYISTMTMERGLICLYEYTSLMLWVLPGSHTYILLHLWPHKHFLGTPLSIVSWFCNFIIPPSNQVFWVVWNHPIHPYICLSVHISYKRNFSQTDEPIQMKYLHSCSI